MKIDTEHEMRIKLMYWLIAVLRQYLVGFLKSI